MISATVDTQIFTQQQIKCIKREYFRDGFYRIPGVLQPSEVKALKAAIDRTFDGNERVKTNSTYSFVAMHVFGADEVFEEMLTREPIIGLMEDILGADCHMIAQNAVRNAPGQAVDTFHVDGAIIYPVPEGRQRHDLDGLLPALICTANFVLTDIPAEEYGPTQYVPGSHYSGQNPNDPHHPNFEGQKPISVFCKAGDVILHNGQCWHRGAPNTSHCTRYLLSIAYGKRSVAQRFHSDQIPVSVIERADSRRRRILGIHTKEVVG